MAALSQTECAAEQELRPYALLKVRWLAPEYRELAERFRRTAQTFHGAVGSKRFAALVTAYHDLHDISHQLEQMNLGLMHAIQSADQTTEVKR
jgi:hypothetical protein